MRGNELRDLEGEEWDEAMFPIPMRGNEKRLIGASSI